MMIITRDKHKLMSIPFRGSHSFGKEEQLDKNKIKMKEQEKQRKEVQSERIREESLSTVSLQFLPKEPKTKVKQRKSVPLTFCCLSS
jgi:hypothetical protein